MSKLKQILAKTYINFLRIIPIKKNRIYFVSNFGDRYSCNPRAFFEYLYSNHKEEFEFYYCINGKDKSYLPKEVKTSKYLSLKDIYYLNTSKYIINNFRFHPYFKKRKSQIYIQTWHGGPVPMKAVEAAVEDRLSKSYLYEAKNDAKYITALTVGSKDIEYFYKKYFWCKGDILNIGTPRYDEVINSTNNDFKKAKEKLNIPINKKLILIAPTFKINKSLEYDLMDNNKLINFFKKELNEDVIIGYRFHPNVAKEVEKLKLDNAINLTNISNTNDVIFASDYIISDFSSIIIDALFCKKSVFCFTPNIDDYINNERHLWTDFNKFPINLCKTETELYKEIKKSKTISANEILKELIENFGITENGNACNNLYKYIKTNNG